MHTNRDEDKRIRYCLTRKFCIEEVVVRNSDQYSIHLHVNGSDAVSETILVKSFRSGKEPFLISRRVAERTH